ncbi:outer membrane protein assembly factor BamB family protein [Streptomyces sp. NPDC001591]|uniref:outer membrane protein assembly factor BamB family protein n=1 Tax=Streptomyces sp. NPDC001591 TaxID=3364589 RepID=UPI003678476C
MGVLMPWEASSGLVNLLGNWMAEDEPPIALYGETAFVATPDRLLVFDTTNQKTRETIGPEGGQPVSTLKESDRNNAAPPVVTDGSSPLVLAPFVVRQAGVGTQASRTSAELVAADAKTGKVSWRLHLDVAGWTKDVTDSLVVSVVGASGSIAVVTLADKDSGSYSNPSTTYAIDLTTRRVLWTQETFKAAVVTGGVVAGTKRKSASDDYSTPTAYDLSTGAERWHDTEYFDIGLRSAGPDLFYLDAREKGSGKSRRRLVDVRTGETRQDDVPSAARCRHDGAGAVVCWGRERVTGVDAKTGATLWQLPDEKAGRIAPRVTSVWHGRVYGKTPDGTVSLDSRTGADLPTPPGIAPDLVNAYTGVAIAKTGGLMAYQSAS